MTSTPESTSSSRSALIDDLAAANHILFDQNVVDAFGHVSARDPENPHQFLLARNIAPAQVQPEDILLFDMEGRALGAAGHRLYLERFIHSEIYRRWPDVNAVVHSHSPTIVSFSVLKNVPLRATMHMAGFVGTRVPIFDLRDVRGDGTDMLIRDAELGKHLAEHFKQDKLVLMRGHGSTVVADSLQRAVYRAIYAETNARTLKEAMLLGQVSTLSEAECDACAASEAEVQRPWALWKEQAQQRRHAASASAP
jgi:HCOMODA/2-hydroxy-3-carboxy-muconic semialdehyde decarboxylase